MYDMFSADVSQAAEIFLQEAEHGFMGEDAEVRCAAAELQLCIQAYLWEGGENAAKLYELVDSARPKGPSVRAWTKLDERLHAWHEEFPDSLAWELYIHYRSRPIEDQVAAIELLQSSTWIAYRNDDVDETMHLAEASAAERMA